MNLVPLLVMSAILIIVSVILSIAQKLLVDYGECKIVINGDRIFNVKGGDTLLSYFIANKVFIPSACGGKSTCGFCKIKVLTGGGGLLPTEEVFINKKEKLSGIRLACQVKVKNDIHIYFPEYLLATKEYTARVEKIDVLTHDIKQVVLRLPASDKILFKSGQYVQFKIPGTDEFRAYSIASPPSRENEIELIVRLVPDGLCSTYIHEILTEGDDVTITGPYGEFCLREDSGRDIICIGGGCGMAPIKSILLNLAQKGMPRKVVYFFGARTKKDLFYTEELRKLEKEHSNFKYVPALSEPRAADKWEGDAGLITQIVERHIGNAGNWEAYLCGPVPMIDASIIVLTKKGIKQENIFYDKF